MIDSVNVKEVEKSLSSVSKRRSHIMLLQHLSSFSDFFLNIASVGSSIEESLGLRAEEGLLPPLNFIIINTTIFHYLNKNSKYHNQILELDLPIDEFLNHPIFKFDFTSLSKTKKNTIDAIAKNINTPRESVRRNIKKWMDINIIVKDKNIGLTINLDLFFNTEIFKDVNTWIIKKMTDNWKIVIDDLIDLKYLNTTHKIVSLNFKKISAQHYHRAVVMLHWYWLLCFSYIKKSKLSFNETCILSSALYFRNYKGLNIADDNLDLYDSGILIPMNASSISDSTLMPRETVRRNVLSLIKKNALIKKGGKILVSELVMNPKFITTSTTKTRMKILHDILITLVYIINPPFNK